MAYSFTITYVTPVVSITEAPTAVFTVSEATYNFTVTEANYNFTVTNNLYTFTSTTDATLLRTENMATAFKGEWNATSTYLRGHIVRYAQAVYVADIPSDQSITSAVAPPGDARWELLFSQTGLTGPQTIAMQRALNLSAWSSTKTYQLGDWVYWATNNHIYTLIGIGGALAAAPGDNPAYWLDIGGGGGGAGNQGLYTTSSVTFANLTVTNQLTVSGVRYPTNNGNLGQVLTTNGENQASWVDISSLAISTASTTQLGGVIVGDGLSITQSGVLNVTSATQFLRFWNLTSDLTTNGFNIVTGLPPTISPATPVPALRIGSGTTANLDAALVFEARDSANSTIKLAGDTVRLYSGTPTSSSPANEIRITTADVQHYGVARFYDDVYISGELYGPTTDQPLTIGGPSVRFLGTLTGAGGGVIDVVSIRFPDGSIQYSSGGTTGSGYVLPIATGATLGGIKIGPGLTIDEGTGIVSVSGGTTGTFTLPIAGPVTLGGVRIPSAGSTGLTVNNISGDLTLNIATASNLGGIRVGANLVIDPDTGILSASSTIGSGIISLTEPLNTNGYRIQNNPSVGVDDYLDLQNGSAELSSGGNFVRLVNTSTRIQHSTKIEIAAPDTQFGSLYDSRIYVGAIYNFSGTGPPLFPEGIQFGDLTVQRTAFQGDNFGFIIASTLGQQALQVDFNNLTYAVDYGTI